MKARDSLRENEVDWLREFWGWCVAPVFSIIIGTWYERWAGHPLDHYLCWQGALVVVLVAGLYGVISAPFWSRRERRRAAQREQQQEQQRQEQQRQARHRKP